MARIQVSSLQIVSELLRFVTVKPLFLHARFVLAFTNSDSMNSTVQFGHNTVREAEAHQGTANCKPSITELYICGVAEAMY